MSAAAGTAPPPEWYLARDGEQFGPLSDTELRKLVEFGHLKPTDLLWREGFPDWRSAKILLEDKSLLGRPTETPSAPVHPSQVTTADPPTKAAATVSNRPGPSPEPMGVMAPAAAAAPQPSRAMSEHPGPTQRAAPYQQQPVSQQRQSHPDSREPAYQTQRPTDYVPMPGPAQTYAPSHPSAHGRSLQAPSEVARYGPGGGQVAHGHPLGTSQPMGQQPGSPLQGSFAQTRPMDLARPSAAAPIATSTRQASAAPVHRGEDEDDDYDDDEEGSRAVVWIKRVAVLIFFTLTLAAAGWYAYPFRDRILNAVNLSALGGLGGGGSPIVGFKATPEATDASLQSTALWQVLKREFPEWYGERVKEAAALAQEQKSDADIGKAMVQAMVALRRKHAGDALSATTPKLKALAAAFADNLVRLREVGVDACHTFIAAGETSPEYLRLLADPNHSRPMQQQLVAVFEAIADGRRIPRIYPQPKQADYNLLVTALETRGWSEADMQLFSDSRRFGQAEPEKVCKMVTDWFQAQINLTEPEAQLRLLADALKPVVAG